MIIFKEIEVIVEVNILKKIMLYIVWYFAINSSSFKSLIYRDFFFIICPFQTAFLSCLQLQLSCDLHKLYCLCQTWVDILFYSIFYFCRATYALKTIRVVYFARVLLLTEEETLIWVEQKETSSYGREELGKHLSLVNTLGSCQQIASHLYAQNWL